MQLFDDLNTPQFNRSDTDEVEDYLRNTEVASGKESLLYGHISPRLQNLT